MYYDMRGIYLRPDTWPQPFPPPFDASRSAGTSDEPVEGRDKNCRVRRTKPGEKKGDFFFSSPGMPSSQRFKQSWAREPTNPQQRPRCWLPIVARLGQHPGSCHPPCLLFLLLSLAVAVVATETPRPTMVCESKHYQVPTKKERDSVTE